MRDKDALQLGELLRRLREDRGLSRAMLTQLSGVSESTIQKTEGGRMEPKRSTLMELYKGLAQSRPLTTRESADFARLTGLAEIIGAVEDATQHLQDLGRTAASAAQKRGAQQLDRFTRTLDAEQARAFVLLWDMMERSTPALTARLLDAMAAMLATRDSARQVTESRFFDVHGAPVQRAGFVEQMITTYEQPAPAPTAPLIHRSQPRRTAT